MDAKTGRVKWKVTTEVIESSLLEVNGDLFFGGWDGKIVSLDAKTGKQRWSYQADSGVTSSVAYHAGNVFVGSDGGAFYALDAGNGKLLWKSGAFSKFGTREYFYATPAVAYGRVYAPNTDGYVYSFGETTGKLRWARKVGTYVYSAPAIYKQTIYVGTYDGFLVALDAATGNVKWKYSTPAAVHGAATVVSGIVYFSTLKGQHSGAARFVKDGPGKTFGLTASSGKLVWSRPEGRYTPIIADGQRMYFTGLGHLYGLEPRK
jgi:outer membrane protein assembly factor BamB